MLTIRFDRLGVLPGDLVLDAGAGFGRHAFELARLGADVVALDYNSDEVIATRGTFGAMVEAGEIEEKRYVGALKHWQSYQTWLAERNPARAELERRFGYDTKHAAHLIRLMRMGLEVLELGELRVRRPDAEELRAIRDGALAYDALLELAHQLEAEMKAALAHSRLPADVDRNRIDALLLAALEVA